MQWFNVSSSFAAIGSNEVDKAVKKINDCWKNILTKFVCSEQEAYTLLLDKVDARLTTSFTFEPGEPAQPIFRATGHLESSGPSDAEVSLLESQCIDVSVL